jgi:hypothetical protein
MKGWAMQLTRCLLLSTIALLAAGPGPARSDDKADVKEKALDAPLGVTIKVRMEGPYTADVPLRVVCYFKYSKEGASRMTGAPVELDKKLGGVIASLRERGEFVGDEGETLLLIPPKESIKAKGLLLVGLGEENALSLEGMERVGRLCLRETARLGVNRVAAADISAAVIRGMLLAYDTEKRLQKEGVAREFTLQDWQQEAGPAYFDETVAGARKAIEDATAAAARRSGNPYGGRKQ